MKTAEEILKEHGCVNENDCIDKHLAIDAMYEFAFHSKWIPIEEGLPENNALRIIVYSKQFECQYIFSVSNVKQMMQALELSHYKHLTPNP